MGSKKKYYVVWVGLNPGVYHSWNAAKANISGYPNAKYKSFPNMESAEEAFKLGFSDFVESVENKTSQTKRKSLNTNSMKDIDMTALSVDAACSGNPGLMEYRAVWVKDHTEVFKQGPFTAGTNNIGEFLALVHALALFKKNNIKLPIYTDSRTAMAWVRKKKANTKLKRSSKNSVLFDLIRRAELWLNENTFENKLLKWNTKDWGEIPADFGRK